MLKVGLTGSIAVGKSFVCDVFREHGCHIIDADRIAREVVSPGTPGLLRITEAFGPEMLLPGGELDRKKLGKIVFEDDGKRQLLNSIIHPLVIEEQDRRLKDLEASDPGGIAIVDAALMIESGGYKRFTDLIVVWCEPDIQLRRLIERDRLSEAEAKKRIAAQMPQEEKKRFANYLIDTSGEFFETRQQTIEIYKRLRKNEEETDR